MTAFRNGEATADIAFTLDLPAAFRPADSLRFHGRDASGTAETVTADGFSKGVTWRGMPTCLTVRFADGRALARLQVDRAGADGGDDGAAAVDLVRRMLGLNQPVEVFEDAYRDHPEVGRLIARNPGLRLPVASSPFEALTWAVTGQQISVAAAVAARRKLIVAAGLRHSGGLRCYPDAQAVARLGPDDLRQAGFSRTKAATVLEVSRRVLDGALPLDRWWQAPDEREAAETLLAIPGIGPWTVGYALLRGFGWLDGSLHGDAAVRRNLQDLMGWRDAPGAKETERWLAPFSPWRALVAAHLWAWGGVAA